MQIDLTNPGLSGAVINRLTKELGETFAANCALDLIADSQAAQIQKISDLNEALIESNTNLRRENEELRIARDTAVIELRQIHEAREKRKQRGKQLAQAVVN